MIRPTEQPRAPWPRLLALAGLAVVAWAYTLAVVVPAVGQAVPAEALNPGIYHSDFYATWRGTVALLQEGRDPYSDSVTAEIQVGVWGHVLTPDDPIQDQHRFVYPLYMVFLLAPTTLVSFSTFMALFPLVGLLVVAAATLGWAAGLGWRMDGWGRTALLLLGISSVPAIHAVYLQQPAVLIMGLLAAAATCLWRGAQAAPTWHNGLYIAAGALLALATVKPQLSGVFVLAIGLWALWGGRERWGVLVGGGVMGLLLVGGSLALLPGWPGEWLAAVRAYPAYAARSSMLFWVPGPLLPVLLGAGALALLALAWRLRAAQPGSLGFSLFYAWAGVYSILLFPSWAPHGQLIIYPAALLVIQAQARLAAAGPGGRRVGRLVETLLFWPWLSAAIVGAVWLVALPLGYGPQASRLWPAVWVVMLLTPVALLAPLTILSRLALRDLAPAPVPAPPERLAHA